MIARTAPLVSLRRALLSLVGGPLVGLLAILMLLAFGLHEPDRRVGPLPPPVTEDAVQVESFLRTLQQIGRSPDRTGDVDITVDALNGMLRVLARTHSDLSGVARIDEAGALAVDVSLRPPWGDRLGWLNLSAAIPAYDGRLRIGALRVGRLSLPPGPLLAALAWDLDRRFGPGTGAQALTGLPRLAIEGDRLTWSVAMPADSDRHLTRATVIELYGRRLPSRTEVARFVALLDGAQMRGELPTEGSFLPWLLAMLDHAAEIAETGDGELETALIAGFMALNQMCGSVHFRNLLLPPRAPGEADVAVRGRGCHNASLRGRVDLRRHFLTAATIKMMSDRSVAIGAGEAKELADMRGAGYDFTDIAANNSGIRLATLIGGMSPAQLRALRDRIGSEEDVMISIAGIPGEMRPAAFRYRFGDLDSPAYREMIAIIEARIDALPIHAAGQGG